MDERTITAADIAAFAEHLRRAERSRGTIENYLRHVRAFARWLDGAAVTKEAAAAWKESLSGGGYRPGSVNAMLGALNRFLDFMGWADCRVKALKIQRRLFRDDGRELTRGEYERLVAAARSLGRERLALLMEAVCATGIRVSEVRYLTVEAARAGAAEIPLKGKIRTILLPAKLCRKLLKYAGKNKIASGEIFLTGRGRGMGRKQIWAEMKALCASAGVAPSKVFPHNLRHLFARTFYALERDLSKLADLLGHSSVETTRLYIITAGVEHLRQLDKMKLVI